MPKACIYAGFRHLFSQMALVVGGVMEDEQCVKVTKLQYYIL